MARSVSPAPIERRNSSAWSPKQYTKVLTCFSSDSSDSPEANRNWSKHLLYFVHSSGAWRLNDPGGWRVAVTVAITSRQHCCHHVVCELRTWGNTTYSVSQRVRITCQHNIKVLNKQQQQLTHTHWAEYFTTGLLHEHVAIHTIQQWQTLFSGTHNT